MGVSARGVEVGGGGSPFKRCGDGCNFEEHLVGRGRLLLLKSAVSDQQATMAEHIEKAAMLRASTCA